ncbi:hypothetical protein HXX76_006350 [Chlamydomonas incerta]|uniref:Guanylate cyclase domain-containing protein n=1 Tax=Chlamydomonas incerta TaxID=51695 RepID=A0A835W4C4_CHLIN|nr:hypothetical protein HXX76_006350 [Chlamydomonas incerta]|eukprot:KAG2436828.1 hypothetical protein HXX76_006350 [Chlamydomonas incerta]
MAAGPPPANSTRPSNSAATSPVYGFCLPPSQQQLAHLTLAVLAPLVQTAGSTQGMYLNADTLRPAATTAAMPYVLSYLRRLAAYSAPVAFSARAPQFSNDFALGRCAMTVGTAAQFRRNSHAAHPAGPSAVIGRVTAALLPGSDVVLSADGQGLVGCTASLCPHGQPSMSAAALPRALPPAAARRSAQASESASARSGELQMQDRQRQLQQAGTVLVNWAPLLSPDGLVAGLDRESETMAQLYGWSFLSSLGGPTVSWQMLLLPSGEVGPWRISHMDAAAALPRWTSGGYQADDTASFLAAARNTLSHANLVKPMRVRSAVQYGRAVAVAAEAAATLPASGAASETAVEAAGVAAAAAAALAAAMANLYSSTGPYGPNFLNELATEYKAVLGVYTKPITAAAESEGSAGSTASVVGIAVGVSIAGVVALSLLGVVLCHRRVRLRGAGGDAPDVDEWMVVPAPQAGPATCIAVTDIEGSTSLWEALPEATMDQALRIHHRIVRAISVRHNGYESATEGDSFIIAFASTTDAAQFALRLQVALLSEASWPQELLAAAPCRPVYVSQDEALAAAHKVSLVPAALARQPIRRGAAGLVVGRMASMTLGRQLQGMGPGADMGAFGALPSSGRFGGGGSGGCGSGSGGGRRSSAASGTMFAGLRAGGGMGGAAGVYGRQNTWQGHAGAIMELTGNMPPPPKQPKGPPKPVQPPSARTSNYYGPLASPLGRARASAFFSNAPGMSSEKNSSVAAGHLQVVAKTLLAVRSSVRSSFVGTFRRGGGGHASSQYASAADISQQQWLDMGGSGVVLQTTSMQQHSPGPTEPSPLGGAAGGGRGSRQSRAAAAAQQSGNLFGSGILFGPGSDAHGGWLKALGSVHSGQGALQGLGSGDSTAAAPAYGHHSGDAGGMPGAAGGSGEAGARGATAVAGARARSGGRRASLTSWLIGGSRAGANRHGERSDGRSARKSSCSGATDAPPPLLQEVPMLQEPPSPPRVQLLPPQPSRQGRKPAEMDAPLQSPPAGEAAGADAVGEPKSGRGSARGTQQESCTLVAAAEGGATSPSQLASPVSHTLPSPQSCTMEAPSKAHAFLAALGLAGDRSVRGRAAGASRLGPGGGTGPSAAGHQSAAQVVFPAMADSLLASAAAAAAASSMLSGPPQLTSISGAVAPRKGLVAPGRASHTSLAGGADASAYETGPGGSTRATVGGGRVDYGMGASGGLALSRRVPGAVSRPGAVEVELEEEAEMSGSLPLAKMLIAARQTSMRVTDFMAELPAGASRQLPPTPRGSHVTLQLQAAGGGHSTRLPSSPALHLHPGAPAAAPHSTRLPTRPQLDLVLAASAQGSGPSDAGRTGTDASGTVDFMDTAARNHGWMLAMPSTAPATDKGTSSTASHQFNAYMGPGSTYSAGGPAASPVPAGPGRAGRSPGAAAAAERIPPPIGCSAPQLDFRGAAPTTSESSMPGFASPLGSTVAAVASASVPHACDAVDVTAAAPFACSSGNEADAADSAASSGGGGILPAYATGERWQRTNGGSGGAISPSASSGAGRHLPSVSPLARMTGTNQGTSEADGGADVTSSSGQLPFMPLEDMSHMLVLPQDACAGIPTGLPQLHSSGSLPANRRQAGAMLSTIVDGDEQQLGSSSATAVASGSGALGGSNGGTQPQPAGKPHGEQQSPWWRHQKALRNDSPSQQQLQQRRREEWLVPFAATQPPHVGAPHLAAASEGFAFPLDGPRSAGQHVSTQAGAGSEAGISQSSSVQRAGAMAFPPGVLVMPALLRGSTAGRYRHGPVTEDGHSSATAAAVAGAAAASATVIAPGAGDVDSGGSGGMASTAGAAAGLPSPGGAHGRPNRAALHERFAELAAETAPHSSRLASVSSSLSFFRLGGSGAKSSQRNVPAASPRGKQPGGGLQQQMQALRQDRQEQPASIKDSGAGGTVWGKSGTLLRGLPLPSLGAFLRPGRNTTASGAQSGTLGGGAGQDVSSTGLFAAGAAATATSQAASIGGGLAQRSAAYDLGLHGNSTQHAQSMALPQPLATTHPEAEGLLRRAPSMPSQRREPACAMGGAGGGGSSRISSTANGMTLTAAPNNEDLDAASAGGFLDSHLLHTNRTKSRLSPSPSGGSASAAASGLEQPQWRPSPRADAGRGSFTARALLFAAGASAAADANASIADSPYGVTVGTANTYDSVLGGTNNNGSTLGTNDRSPATPPPDHSYSGATAGLYRLLSGGQGQGGAAPSVPTGLPFVGPGVAAAAADAAVASARAPAVITAPAPEQPLATAGDVQGAQDAWVPSVPRGDAQPPSTAAASVGAFAAVAPSLRRQAPSSAASEMQPVLGGRGGPPGGGSKLMEFFRQWGPAVPVVQSVSPSGPAPPSRVDQISEALPVVSLAAYMGERSEVRSSARTVTQTQAMVNPLPSKVSEVDGLRSGAADGALASPGGDGGGGHAAASGSSALPGSLLAFLREVYQVATDSKRSVEEDRRGFQRGRRSSVLQQLAQHHNPWGVERHGDSEQLEGAADGQERQLVFSGLRVRVGLHCGVTDARDIQYNAATARMTFGGEGLRIAKAVCDCASGGQVVMSGEVLFQIQVAGGLGAAAAGQAPRMMLDLGDHQLFETISTSYVPAVPGAYNRQRTALALMQQSGMMSIAGGTEGGGAADMLLATHRSMYTENDRPAVPVTRHLLALTSPDLMGRLALMPPVRSDIHQYTPGFMDAPVGESVTVVVFRVSNAASLLAWSTATAAEAMAIMELYLRASLGPLLAKTAADGRQPLACYLAAAPPGSPFGTFVAGFSQPAAAARWALTTVARMTELPWPAELLESQWGRPLEEVTRVEAEAADTRAVARRGRMSSAGSGGMLRSDSSEAALQAVAAAAAAAAAGGGASVSSSRRSHVFRRASPPATSGAGPDRGGPLKGRSRSRVELPAVLDNDEAGPAGGGRPRSAALAVGAANAAAERGHAGLLGRAISGTIVVPDDAGGGAVAAAQHQGGDASSSTAPHAVDSDISFGMQRSVLTTGDGGNGLPQSGPAAAGGAGSGSASFYIATTASAAAGGAASVGETPNLPHIELLESHGAMTPMHEDSQHASAMELMLLPQHAVHASHLPVSEYGTSVFASDLKAGGLTSGPAGASDGAEYGASPDGRSSIVQLSMPQGVLGGGTDLAAATAEAHAGSDGVGTGSDNASSGRDLPGMGAGAGAGMASLRTLLLGRGSGKRAQQSPIAAGGARHSALRAAEAVNVHHEPGAGSQPAQHDTHASAGTGTAGTGLLSSALLYDGCSSAALPDAARYTSSAVNTHSAAVVHGVTLPSAGGGGGGGGAAAATYSMLHRKSATAAAGDAASLLGSGGSVSTGAAAVGTGGGGRLGSAVPAAENSATGGRAAAAAPAPGARARTAPFGPSASVKRLLGSVSNCKVAAGSVAGESGTASNTSAAAAAAVRARTGASGYPMLRMRGFGEDASSVYSAEDYAGAAADAGEIAAADASAAVVSAGVTANPSVGTGPSPSSGGVGAGASTGGSALARYVGGGLRQTARSALNASLSFVGQRLHSGPARQAVASAVHAGLQPVSKSGVEASWSSRSGRARLLRAITPDSPVDMRKRVASKSALALATADEATIAAAAAAAAKAEAAAAAAAAARAEEDAEVVSFRGLRVRLGMAIGAVRVELCPLTGRVVYSGKTVTVAMTAAASARLGTLYVTDQAATLIRAADGEGAAAGPGADGGGGETSCAALSAAATSQQQPLVCTPAPPMTVAGTSGATTALLVNGKNVPFRCRFKRPLPPLDEREQQEPEKEQQEPKEELHPHSGEEEAHDEVEPSP